MKQIRNIALLLLLTLQQSVYAQSKYDIQKPFGFSTSISRTEAGSFDLTGGGEYAMPIKGQHVTLVSTGQPMDKEISAAIKNNSIIIFDGSKGDFIFSKILSFKNLTGKTILGINNARLCTSWYVTDDDRKMLIDAGVPNMKTSSGTGGVLPNGANIGEEAEYNTRKMLLEKYGNEDYRDAGLLAFTNCENLIIRNLTFAGPGSIDVGGSDLLTLKATKHVWVDHCDFADGMDDNFDITQSSDFITVSWCRFHYTDRSFMHQNSNLIGANDREPRGFLNVTFAYNNWGEGCHARMPLARIGKIHMLCNLYDCVGNVSPCINPRIDSEVLCEGNYIDQNIKNFFRTKDAKAWQWQSDNVITNPKANVPLSSGPVTMPYAYPKVKTKNLPEEIRKYVGPTL